ncbi:pirin family protein [Ralstonia mannitolilytica]|uniref:Quercetin 2,3-dioxygenase n=1 Tax=Ralstonia mannitolilytica TaxID=105219 RepID=A0AAJ4ZJT1_9RALS|nr:pirin family protein [Ralstonia mannitolilytica]CAG2141136.1 Quercetin 2,3-dioxygenase [Ralstonia mannitolilytica]CAJ0733594.1 Quercetin 2,3-dioxygenase [Ralstonia mannitolilytica]SUD87137.1 Quercetin 2,3-dioxygenase [Ralstonia mannitolilytica]SUD93060.1 Quercetin 2,3-dioxygenase [Ralstonia mannitolilytica]SUD96798.1 Quercetin 2,3-dioxygenase [Ralstonia mannitolilytica]
MIEMRPSQDRGYADHGWLKSYHSFSFADYMDPEHVQFGPLRVINEDRVAPGMGFGTHGHRDMEIISYVLDGELAHKDSMGNGSVLRPGDVQRMTAGTGVRHSEFNHAQDQTTHFLQIWVLPAQMSLTPSYEERHFDAAAKRGKLALIASADGRDGSVEVHQDMALYAGRFDGAEAATLSLADGRRAYVHVVRGKVSVNGRALTGGDAAKLTHETAVTLSDGEDSEVLVFDLP